MMMMVVPAMMVVMAMPTMMPMMVPMPTDLGGLYLGTLLHCRGGAGVGQRQRLGALGWSSQDQQSADRSQSQKSRHVHVYSPLESSGVSRLRRG
jgi:hypothetical protein